MSRAWELRGVSSHGPIDITDESKRRIREALQPHGIEVTDAFFTALGIALGSYEGAKELKSSTKPRVVVKKLKRALDAAQKLDEALKGLDQGSRLLLSEAVDGDYRSIQSENLKRLMDALHGALVLARSFSRGKLPAYERVMFGILVADAMYLHLGSQPTTTKEGPFEQLLAVCLEIATNDRVKAPHELAGRVITHWKDREPVDTIPLYYPPNPNNPDPYTST